MSEEGPEDISMGLWPEVRAIDGAGETLMTQHKDRLKLRIEADATVDPVPLFPMSRVVDPGAGHRQVGAGSVAGATV